MYKRSGRALQLLRRGNQALHFCGIQRIRLAGDLNNNDMIEPEIAGSTDGGLYVDILSVGGSVDRGRYRSPVCLRPGQDISLLYVVVDITPCRRRKAFTEIQPDFASAEVSAEVFA